MARDRTLVSISSTIPIRRTTMHLDPVFPDFRSVTIRRTGGFLGVDQTLRIDRDLAATVTDRDEHHEFQLDAYSSQELLHALSRLATARPEASRRQGCDLFHYDIELAYNGTVYRISSVELGAEEALAGVMFAANSLIDAPRDPIHAMSMHPATA
jgi:hypothetical protein